MRPAKFVDRTTTQTTTHFGAALRRLRIRSQLSLGQLAARSGLNISTLSHYESGRPGHEVATRETVFKLARALDDSDSTLWYAVLQTRYEQHRAAMQKLYDEMQKYR